VGTEGRRLAILHAAKDVFAERGYPASGVSDIIERAGVARGTFYLYFESKRTVFTALVDHALQAIQDSLVPVPLDQPERIVQGLMDNAERIKRVFLEDPALAKVIIVEAMLLDREASEQVGEVEQRVADWLAGLVTRWQEKGLLRTLDPRIVAWTYIGSLKEILRQHLITGRLEAGLEAITAAILEIYVFGLIAPEHQQLAADHFAGIHGPAEGRD